MASISGNAFAATFFWHCKLVLACTTFLLLAINAPLAILIADNLAPNVYPCGLNPFLDRELCEVSHGVTSLVTQK